MGHGTSKATLQQALDAWTKYEHSNDKASYALGLNYETFRSRLKAALRQKLSPSAGLEDIDNPRHLRAKIKRLEIALRSAEQQGLDHSIIKNKIIQLGQNVAEIETPSWMLDVKTGHDLPGVPTLFLSDFHWGEVIDPKQIGGVNSYNMEIAQSRLREVMKSAIRLLTILSPTLKYPGIVVPLGGDMVSGNIHDELMVTNEVNTMPTVLDLFENLGETISTLADKLGRVFLPCVSGNHGRDTRKIWAKDRHHTSFDWLLYCFLAKHFGHDKRITFLIPDGPDAYYKIYDHRYCLTHGDQFRSFGDSMIGALGPLVRGEMKKRARNAQINQEFDTMICGHWHQYIHLTRLIVNGSLKGLDEYAYSLNYPYEPARQALWLNHPRYGITYRMPILVAKHEPTSQASSTWVSVYR